jgi:hypothetical protein
MMNLFTCKQHDFILLYDWIKSIVYLYHIFLIHSSVMEHLGCFQSLAIVNSAAISMGVWVALSYPGVYSSAICSGEEWYHWMDTTTSYHMAVLFLVFCKSSVLLSIAVALIWIPTNSVEVFISHTSSPAFVVCVTDYSNFDWG